MLHLRHRAALIALAALVTAHGALRAHPGHDATAAQTAPDGSVAPDLTPGSPNVTLLSYGLTAEPDTNATSPDASGDVGATQYLLAANGRIRSFCEDHRRRRRRPRTPPPTCSSPPSGTAPPPRAARPLRPPRRRWLVLMTTAVLPNRYLLAVSTTATAATGDWVFLQWTNTRTQGGVGGGPACLGDDPTLGLDEDAIYVGVNQRCGATLNTLDLRFDVALRPAAQLGAGRVGRPTAPRSTSSSPRRPAPASTRRRASPTSTTTRDQGYVIGVDNLAKGRLVLRRISNPGGSARRLSADVVITQDVDPTGDPIDVPHPSGVLPLDGLDHRLGQAVDPQRPAVDLAPLRGRQLRRGRPQRQPQRRAMVRADVADRHPVAGAVGHRLGYRRRQSGQLLDQRDHAERPGPCRARHVHGRGACAGSTPRSPAGWPATRSARWRRRRSTRANTSSPTTCRARRRRRRRGAALSSTSLDPDDDMTLWTLQQFVDGHRFVGPAAGAHPGAAAGGDRVAGRPEHRWPSGLTGAVVTVTGTAVAGAGFFDPGAGFAAAAGGRRSAVRASP